MDILGGLLVTVLFLIYLLLWKVKRLTQALKALIMGKKHGKFEGIETQLPASFIITADKLIKYAYYGKRINDVPSLETLAGYIE